MSPVAWSSLLHRHQPRHATTSSTSSTATRAPTCRGCRRPTSASVTPLPQAGPLRIPLGNARSCACCAGPSRSGRSSASTASGARSCGCRSPSRPTASTAPSCAAMCVPDLLGTQGTFLLFTTRPRGRAVQGGRASASCSSARGDRFDAAVAGPGEHLPRRRPAARAAARDRARPRRRAWRRVAHRRRQRLELARGQLSDWVHAAPSRPRPGSRCPGSAGCRSPRWASTSRSTCRPINLDPEQAGDADLPPVLLRHLPGQEDRALRHPRPGRGHLGAQREGHRRRARSCSRPTTSTREREAMFFAALDQLAPRRPGLRLRRHRPHPAHVLALPRGGPPGGARARRRPRTATPSRSSTGTTTRWSARCWTSCAHGDLLMVLSDHGFTSFRRGVNLNAWLLGRGLPRPQGRAPTARAEWLRDVDWSRTRAYALGLTGIFLNLQAAARREGIVAPGAEAAALKAELDRQAVGLRDDERDEVGHQRGLRHRRSVYDGPYLDNAPDLIDRLQRRLPHLVGLRPPAWSPGRCSRTTSRPGAATTASTRGWSRASSSATTPIDARRPGAGRHRADRARICSASSHARHMEGKPLFARIPTALRGDRTRSGEPPQREVEDDVRNHQGQAGDSAWSTGSSASPSSPATPRPRSSSPTPSRRSWPSSRTPTPRRRSRSGCKGLGYIS